LGDNDEQYNKSPSEHFELVLVCLLLQAESEYQDPSNEAAETYQLMVVKECQKIWIVNSEDCLIRKVQWKNERESNKEEIPVDNVEVWDMLIHFSLSLQCLQFFVA